MLGVAACFFVAGCLLGVFVLRLTRPKSTEVATTSANAPASFIPSGAATASQPANSLSSFSAKVVSITDGDTVDVVGSSNLTYAVRLAGIDAPEHDQAFGRESTQHLSELLSGKTATFDCESERSYGRLICKILLPDGEDVCFDRVRAGMAWHYKQYQDEQSAVDRAAYGAAECAAMKDCMSSEPLGQVSNGFKRGSGPSELKLWLQTDGAAGVVARWF